MHGLIDHSWLEIVENVVMILQRFGLIHQGKKLFLKDFPSDLDTLDAQLVLCPLLQLDVHRSVEGAWFNCQSDLI